MEGERDKARSQNQGSGEQQPVGQDRPDKEQKIPGSEPPRSMGTKGTEFGQFADHDRSGQQGQSGTGQADLGSQAGSTLSGHTDQQELGDIGGEVDQPGSYAGGASGRQAATQGEGFFLRETGSSERAIEGEDFASQGQGALDGEQEDVELGESRGGGSDIEQP